MSAHRIVKGNLTIVIWGDYRVYARSYDVLIMDIIIDKYSGRNEFVTQYFNSTRYSNTTTRHQGYCADIFVRITTAKNPREEISKISTDNLHYMSVAERKHWNLV